ncbi:hypothetical protein ACFVAD_07685 [Sutcliffiella sp. NPDC057660]|uniref:hypothetical protein n=1 Tax=Sutcliffiella sp. NPDC057660 TaxID=3346199 RepID=UPI003690DA00
MSVFAFSYKNDKPAYTFEVFPEIKVEIYEDTQNTYWPKLVENRFLVDKETSFSGVIHDTSEKYFDYSILEISTNTTLLVGIADTENVEKVIFKSDENDVYVEKAINGQIFFIFLPNITGHPEVILKNDKSISYPYSK